MTSSPVAALNTLDCERTSEFVAECIFTEGGITAFRHKQYLHKNLNMMIHN